MLAGDAFPAISLVRDTLIIISVINGWMYNSSRQVESLDELISVHDHFLKELIFKCLLLDKTRPVMNIIESILSCVMRFSTQILVEQFRPQSLSSIHRSFKENFKLLFKGNYMYCC